MYTFITIILVLVLYSLFSIIGFLIIRYFNLKFNLKIEIDLAIIMSIVWWVSVLCITIYITTRLIIKKLYHVSDLDKNIIEKWYQGKYESKKQRAKRLQNDEIKFQEKNKDNL